MNYVVVESEEDGRQLFGFPKSIEHEEFSKILSFIKHGSDRNWKRIKRLPVESGELSVSQITSEMKYIVTESEAGRQLFIFPKAIDHDRMAEVLIEAREQVADKFSSLYRGPVSAGFTDGRSCRGHSETLGIKSNPSDSELLKK